MHNFAESQHKVTWIVLIPLVFLASKVASYLTGSSNQDQAYIDGDEEWDQQWQFLLHRPPNPPLVDTLLVKATLLLLLESGLMFHLLYIGVCTTRLHEHNIPHILLLKKAELHCGAVLPIYL